MPQAKSHNVKVHLAARGETQVQLAAAIGVSAATIYQVLNGNHVPWPALKHRIAVYLGVPESDLWPDPVDRLLADRQAQGFGSEPSAAATAAIGTVLRRRTHVDRTAGAPPGAA